VRSIEYLGVTPEALGADATRALAFRRLALNSAVAEIAGLFQARGVRPLLIKGPAFARWLYDNPRDRWYNDIDLLVSPSDFEAAKRGLAELRFESLPQNAMHANEHSGSYHEEWVRSGALPIPVDLHHTLRSVSAEPTLVWRLLTEDAETIEVSGARIDVPSDVVSALILSLHAANHGIGARAHDTPLNPDWPQPGGCVDLNVGGRYARRDLQLAVQRVDVETWRSAAALAQKLGAGPLFAFGLRLDPTGRDLADRLGLSDRMTRPLRLRTSAPPGAAIAIEKLISAHGTSARLRLLAHQLVPSRTYMLTHSALARRGRLGLICAYLWRPFRLMVRLPSGLRAWVRAAVPAARTGRREASNKEGR